MKRFTLNAVGKSIWCGRCSNTDFTSVQYEPGTPQAYDGISEFVCNSCRTRYGRWSGKELRAGERENANGEKINRRSYTLI